MKLTDLSPVWLLKDGGRVGFVFRCPLEIDNPMRLQSCFFSPTAREEQWDIFAANGITDEACIVQGCNPVQKWVWNGLDFDALTVTPSINGAPGGNWHGFITNGEILDERNGAMS